MSKWEAVQFGPGKEYVTLYRDGNDILDDAPIVTEIARKLNAFDEMLAALRTTRHEAYGDGACLVPRCIMLDAAIAIAEGRNV